MAPWLESLQEQSALESADLSLAVRSLGLAYVGQVQPGLFPGGFVPPHP